MIKMMKMMKFRIQQLITDPRKGVGLRATFQRGCELLLRTPCSAARSDEHIDNVPCPTHAKECQRFQVLSKRQCSRTLT